MTDQERLNQFVQDVYLMRYNREIDDITDEDGVVEVRKTLSFCRMFLDEIQSERNPDGTPINWRWTRNNDLSLGTIADPDGQTLPLPAGVRRLVVDEDRPLVFMQGDAIISEFEMVEADQITRRQSTPGRDRASTVRRSVVFSRKFKDYEQGAEAVADAIMTLPVLSLADVSLLDIVPYQLLVLGTAKNAVRPDIVQGGLAPSFIEQYADELDKAIAENTATSVSDEATWEDFSGIGGVY